MNLDNVLAEGDSGVEPSDSLKSFSCKDGGGGGSFAQIRVYCLIFSFLKRYQYTKGLKGKHSC